jgi:predicted RNase H-like nuclease
MADTPRIAATPLATADLDNLQWHAGVDGCRGGWVVVLAAYRGSANTPVAVHVRLCRTFAEVLTTDPRARIIALDMPIGLLDAATPGGRDCDRLARAVLGAPRAASVFTPPARPALSNDGYRDAMRRNGAGLSKQAYNILPRIREVDDVMSPALQARVFETHPELVFARIAGAPLRHAKRTEAGARERRRWLRHVWGALLPQAARVRERLGRAALAEDDVLDACALAYAAWCIASGHARRVPDAPPLDSRGLRMEVWG